MNRILSGDSQSSGAEPDLVSSADRRRVVITGVTGTLGDALARAYRARAYEVVGVSHRPEASSSACHRLVRSPQATALDAERLLDLEPDILILNAGRIETEVGPAGVPLVEVTREIFTLNAIFPSLVCAVAGVRGARRRLDIVAIGSIADGSPSCFGPAYHASKTALHSFVTGAGPIVHAAHPNVRIRLYRPGVIRGPLSWAPVLRLNERGAAIRARRCRNAPEASRVAERIARWIDSGGWVGSDPAPFSFRALQLLHALAPDLYYRVQRLGWRRGSRFEDLAGRGIGIDESAGGTVLGARPMPEATKGG